MNKCRNGTKTTGFEESVVAINALAFLVSLLRFQPQSGDVPRIEPFQADRLASLFAIALSFVFNAAQRRIDFVNQLAMAVARAQFQLFFGL